MRGSSEGIRSRSAGGIGGEVGARHGSRRSLRDYGGLAFSGSEYCSRSMRRSLSRGLPRSGSAMSSRMQPNSASVSRLYVSLVHSDEDAKETVAAFERAFARV